MKFIMITLFLSISMSMAHASTNILMDKKTSERQLSAFESIHYINWLGRVDREGYNVCYLNINNYNDRDILKDYESKYRTFTDVKTKDTYVYTYLDATIPLTGLKLPEDTKLKQIAENEFMIEYKKDFKITGRNKAFTEVFLASTQSGVVQHFFKVIDRKIRYQHSKFDILTEAGSKPHVRCVAIEKVTEKGLLWGTNVTYKHLPIPDMQLEANSCRGSGRTCNEKPELPRPIF